MFSINNTKVGDCITTSLDSISDIVKSLAGKYYISIDYDFTRNNIHLFVSGEIKENENDLYSEND